MAWIALCTGPLQRSGLSGFVPLSAVSIETRMYSKRPILNRRNGDNGDAEFFGEQIDIDLTSQRRHFIDHVECQSDRDIEFDQLQGKIETALKACRVNDV